MNRIYKDTAKKFNITQIQAENIFLSVFKFIKDELNNIDFHKSFDEQRHSFMVPKLGKFRVNTERVNFYNKKYREKNNGEDCTYI